MERWATIPNTHGGYEVSDKGRIRSLKTNRILKTRAHKTTGYEMVCLCVDNKATTHLVHRLVAQAFIGDPEPGQEVNHLDENKLNNCVENLEYCSHAENIKHGTGNIRRSIHNKGQKRSEETKRKNSEAHSMPVYMLDKNTGEILRTFLSAKNAAEELKKAYNANISRVCRGLRKTAYGYKWAYVPQL